MCVWLQHVTYFGVGDLEIPTSICRVGNPSPPNLAKRKAKWFSWKTVVDGTRFGILRRPSPIEPQTILVVQTRFEAHEPN
jgi:hypothetical protein